MPETELRQSSLRRPSATARVVVLLVAAIALSVFGAAPAFAISRNTALARAQGWVDKAVPYSQKKYFEGYRTDCSGFASMVWHSSKPGHNTRSMHYIAHKITIAQLKPGDALLKAGYHIMVFYGWLDDTHTQFVAYEEVGPAKANVRTMSDVISQGYKPYRYDKITDSAASRNVLRNPTFDVWTSDWNGGQSPAWWLAGGGSRYPVKPLHRKDVARTGKSSLELLNQSALSRDVVSLSQTASVTANATYGLSAWVRTNGDPRAVTFSVQYMDASGAVLSRLSTTGTQGSLDTTTFRWMGLTAVTPTGTVKATVVLALAGGTIASTDTTGVYALLDDVSLARPPLPLATLTTPQAGSSAHVGKAFAISGYLKPRHLAGTVAIALQAYRYQSGTWVLRKTVHAAVSDYSDYSKYATRLSLPYKGSWRIRAYHDDSSHRASYSSYRSVRVR